MNEDKLRQIPANYKVFLDGIRAVVVPPSWSGTQSSGCGAVLICYDNQVSKKEAWEDLQRTRWPRFWFDGQLWSPLSKPIRAPRGQTAYPRRFRVSPFRAAHGLFPGFWSWSVLRWTMTRPSAKYRQRRQETFDASGPSAFSRLTQLSFDF